MTELRFSKMHGLGNDFIILENIDIENNKLYKLARKLCDRRLGIGADGVLLVLPSDKADFRMRIINSDGSEAEMCGNGIRCFAKYVYEKGKTDKKEFAVETLAGIMIPELNILEGRVSSVRVNMGKPDFRRDEIPMRGGSEKAVSQPLKINGYEYNITSMLMGVPHTIVYSENVDLVDIEKEGSLIEKNDLFPEGTNVDFVEVINQKEIKVRTWERGAGATLACGTGCCASAVSSVLNNKTKGEVNVHLPVGIMTIEWKDGGDVFMTGPAEMVFEGITEF